MKDILARLEDNGASDISENDVKFTEEVED
jgi:hypothetical protein